MKVLIIGINFLPEVVGVGKYTGEMAITLAAAGHEVHVVTGPPYYPAWQREQGWPRFLYRHERVVAKSDRSDATAERGAKGALDIYRCPIYVPRRPTGLRRLLHLASFAASAIPVLAFQTLWRPRVVIAIAPTLFCAPCALLAAAAARAPTWLHVQDFEVDAAYELGLLRGRIVRGILASSERWLLGHVDCVSTISVAMRGRLWQKGVAQRRTQLLPNWVDTTVIYPMGKASLFRERLGIADGRVVVLYSGTMNEKQGLEIVVRAAQALKVEPVDFVFCGDGPAKAPLQAMAEGLANVYFMPLQPDPLLNELLNLADIHALPQRADAADLVMPSKLAGMLASGRPVVATANAGTQVSRSVEGCGRVVAPHDSDAFARVVSELARDPGQRARLGAAGRARAEAELDRDRILAEFQRQLVALAEPQ